MAHEFLKLHPSRAPDLGLRGDPGAPGRSNRGTASRSSTILRCSTGSSRGQSSSSIIRIGSQNWHGDLLKAIFLLAFYEGYIRAQTNAPVNIPNACRYVLERTRRALDRAITTEALGALPGFGLV